MQGLINILISTGGAGISSNHIGYISKLGTLDAVTKYNLLLSILFYNIFTKGTKLIIHAPGNCM